MQYWQKNADFCSRNCPVRAVIACKISASGFLHFLQFAEKVKSITEKCYFVNIMLYLCKYIVFAHVVVQNSLRYFLT